MNADAVAEQTILLMLSAIKNVAGNDRAVRDGNQIQVKEGYMVDGSRKNLSDYTVGLLGFGNIERCIRDRPQAGEYAHSGGFDERPVSPARPGSRPGGPGAGPVRQRLSQLLQPPYHRGYSEPPGVLRH